MIIDPELRIIADEAAVIIKKLRNRNAGEKVINYTHFLKDFKNTRPVLTNPRTADDIKQADYEAKRNAYLAQIETIKDVTI